MNTTFDDMSGKILDGRYKIEKNVGSGGMAQVYKGIDLLLERPVAIKILNGNFAKDNAFVARFKGEAQAAGKLNNAHIVNMYDVGVDQGYHYIIMEYVEGITLKEYIQKEGKLSVEESVKIAVDIAEGLEQAHSMGIVHCDIKPHNIMITPSGMIKVTDFGIARAINSSETLMYTTSVMGSAHYLSPEQASGKPIDGASDMYSLGVVLYEMLTGRVPYEGESPISVALKHVNENLTPPSRYNPNIPPLLEAAVMKALEKKSCNRFTSITEMISDLRLSFGFVGGKSNRMSTSYDYATKVMPTVKEQNVNPIAQSNAEEKTSILDTVTQIPLKTIMVVAFLLFVVAFGVGYTNYGNFWSNASIQVPNVVGKDINEAKKILADDHLQVIINEVQNSDIPAGEVVSMIPKSGSAVKEQRKIKLLVSKGAGAISVPSVQGMSLEDAKAALEKVGFKDISIERKVDMTLPAGVILAQEPSAATESDKNTPIKLIISEKSNKETSTPEVEGKSLAEARKILAAKNLQIIINGDHEDKALIVEQYPQKGATVKEGTSISVTTSIKKAREKEKTQKGEVNIIVPKGASKQVVKIVVIDDNGRRVVYDAKHKPKDHIEQAVSGVGTVRVQVYINNNLVQDQIL